MPEKKVQSKLQLKLVMVLHLFVMDRKLKLRLIIPGVTISDGGGDVKQIVVNGASAFNGTISSVQTIQAGKASALQGCFKVTRGTKSVFVPVNADTPKMTNRLAISVLPSGTFNVDRDESGESKNEYGWGITFTDNYNDDIDGNVNTLVVSNMGMIGNEANVIICAGDQTNNVLATRVP